jgi:hypothetical protein
MPAGPNNANGDPAARAARALERGATALTTSVARSLYGRWRRMPAAQRERIERIADDVKGRPAPEPTAASAEPARIDRDVSEVEVRDLRDELARELERLVDADIEASRGPGSIAGETAPAEGQA